MPENAPPAATSTLHGGTGGSYRLQAHWGMHVKTRLNRMHVSMEACAEMQTHREEFRWPYTRGEPLRV